MSAEKRYTQGSLRSAIAGFMVIWLSGVVFLFCCEGMGSGYVDADHCPMMAKMSPHCDKADNGTTASEFVERSREACVDCCGFCPAVFDKNRRIEQAQKIAVPAGQIVEKQSLPAITVAHVPVLQAARERLPNLQKSFIQNCVFRI